MKTQYKLNKNLPFTHYENIVNSYKTIKDVQVSGKKVIVTGKILKITQVNTYTYDHEEVAKEVAKRVSYFKGL